MDHNRNIGERVAGIALLLVLLLPAACSPRIIKEIVTETKIEYRDSLVYKDTLIRVPIPLEKDQAIVRIGDTSRLETSVAESVAYIDSTGFLHHGLENKKVELSALGKIPVHYHFTGVTTTTTETLTKVEKDKSLNWWQKFRINAFWWLLGALVICLLWIFRKFIFKI